MFRSIQPINQLSILLVLIITLIFYQTTTVQSLQITRTKEGDRVPGLFCEGGTLIFRDDETHSLQCVKSLEEAGMM